MCCRCCCRRSSGGNTEIPTRCTPGLHSVAPRRAFPRAVGFIGSRAAACVRKATTNANTVLHHDHFGSRVTRATLDCGNCSGCRTAASTAPQVEVDTQRDARVGSGSSALALLNCPQVDVHFLGRRSFERFGRRGWCVAKVPALSSIAAALLSVAPVPALSRGTIFVRTRAAPIMREAPADFPSSQTPFDLRGALTIASGLCDLGRS